MKEIDARGLSCPQPVILASNAISEGVFPFLIILDSAASRDNVSRVSNKKGFKAECSEDGGIFKIVIDKK